MTIVFAICAALGGTILVVQFVLTLIGFGADSFDIDVPDDASADFDVDTNLDFDADAPADASHFDSNWFFAVISFRTVVAALAFFGLAGLAAQSAGLATVPTLAIAVGAGLTAMLTVYWIMRGLMSMQAEGTAHIAGAVGRTGTVYTTIPAEAAGAGKIQLNLQGRTMEYLAMTSGKALRPGTKVVVGSVISADTLEVAPALEISDDNPISTKEQL